MMNISRILLACLLNILSVPVGSIFSERVYLRDNVVELDNSNAVKQRTLKQFLDWWDCNLLKEEPCFDEYWNIISCAPYAEGGCKCPVGKERCGATDHHKGWCASVCCDPKTEVSCWKLNSQFKFDVTACAPKEEGWRGCPCPEGQSRCGPDQTPSGLCSPICCDKSTQVYCFTTSWLDYDAYCVDIGEQC